MGEGQNSEWSIRSGSHSRGRRNRGWSQGLEALQQRVSWKRRCPWWWFEDAVASTETQRASRATSTPSSTTACSSFPSSLFNLSLVWVLCVYYIWTDTQKGMDALDAWKTREGCVCCMFGTGWPSLTVEKQHFLYGPYLSHIYSLCYQS